MNKTNLLPLSTLQGIDYLAYKINPAHEYYYLIDIITGITLVLGDANSTAVLMGLTRWPESYVNWDLILTAGMALVGFVMFVGIYRYSSRELRIAPRNTRMDRLRIYFSSTIFALLIVLVVLFIVTIILTAIGENWILALDFGVPVSQGGTTVIQPLEPAWQVEFGFIQALEWPTFIPISTVLIGLYIIGYPFFEMAFLTRRGSDSPTEIQRLLESNVIDVLPRPLNYVVASGYLFILYIVPTYLIYVAFQKYFPGWQDLLQLNLLLVSITWFTIPAFFFLNYYASFGIASMFLTSVGKGFKSKSPVTNLINLITFGISVILLITTTYNFADNTANLLKAGISGNTATMLPSIILQNPSGITKVVLDLINALIPSNPALMSSINDFFAVFPFELLLFFITVCVVGLWGFYSKFLSKEPLNRPILVLFASYIIGAVGINVFINVVLRIPNAFPEGFLVPAFTNPNNYAYGSTQYMADYWNHFTPLRLLFYIPYYLNYALLFVLVVYNVLSNKELKLDIKESVFNYGIQSKRIDILSKYTKSPKEKTQLAVLDNIYRIMKTTQTEPSQIISALKVMITSGTFNINLLANKTLRLLAKKHTSTLIAPVFLAGIQAESDVARKGVTQSLVRVGRKQPNKIIRLYKELITSDLNAFAQQAIVTSLKELNATNLNILENVVLPLLDHELASVRIGILKIAKKQASHLQAKSVEIVPKLLQFSKQEEEEEVGLIIELAGTLGTYNPALASDVLPRLKEMLQTTSLGIKQKTVHALLNLMITLPARIDEFLPQITEFLKDPAVEIRAEVGTTLCEIGPARATTQIFDHIKNILRQVLNDQAEEVRVQAACAIASIGKANSNLLEKDPDFKNLVEMIIKDPAVNVRAKSIELFIDYATISPSKIIFDILLNILAKNLLVVSNRTIFEIISHIVESFPKDGDIKPLLNSVLTTDRTDDEIRREITEILHQISRIRTQTLKVIIPVLLELVNDNKDEIATSAVMAIGDITQLQLSQPQFPEAVNPEAIVNLLIEICKKRPGLPRVKAVTSIANIYEFSPILDKKIYPVFLDLQKETEPEVVQRIIHVLTNMVCSKKEEFAPQKGEQLINGQWVPSTKFNSEFLPALNQMMIIKDKGVMDELSLALNKIVATFPDASQEIGEFLKHSIGSDQSYKIRLVALSVLGNFAPVLEEPQLINALVLATSKWQPEEIRANALNAIGTILEKISEKISLDPVHLKRVRSLIRALFKKHFLKDPRLEVRRYFANTLVMIAKKRPAIDKTYLFLRHLVIDEDEQISMIAIRGFFAAINMYPQKIPEYAHFFRGFGRSHHLLTRKALKEEIRYILNKTGKMEQVLPTILLQAGDENQDVCHAAFEDFKTLFEKHPEEVDYFHDILQKLMQANKKTTRVEVIPAVIVFLMNHPDYITSGDQIFQIYLDLSRDPIGDVRLQMLVSLKQVLKLASNNQLNPIFQALFRLVHENNRQIQDLAVECFHILLERFPSRISDMLRDLVKLNSREQNVLMTQFIKEMKTELKKNRQKRPPKTHN